MGDDQSQHLICACTLPVPRKGGLIFWADLIGAPYIVKRLEQFAAQVRAGSVGVGTALSGRLAGTALSSGISRTVAGSVLCTGIPCGAMLLVTDWNLPLSAGRPPTGRILQAL